MNSKLSNISKKILCKTRKHICISGLRDGLQYANHSLVHTASFPGIIFVRAAEKTRKIWVAFLFLFFSTFF